MPGVTAYPPGSAFLITGAGGQLGSVLLERLARHGEPAVGTVSPAGPAPGAGGTRRVDITDAHGLSCLLESLRPRVVVNAAAVSSVAAAHADPARAEDVNAAAAASLAAMASRSGARFVQVSTDMVFDGEQAPYTESATPRPLSRYGWSKLEGERRVLGVPGVLVVRLPLLYGIPAAARSTTFLEQISALRAGRELSLFHDEFRTPLSLWDAAGAILRAARSEHTGVLHLGGPERLSRLEMGLRVAERLGISTPNVRAIGRGAIPGPEPRARDLSLDSSTYATLFGALPGRPMAQALAAMDLDPVARGM